MECKDPRHRKAHPPVYRRFTPPRVAVRSGVRVHVWSEGSSTKY
jgi:hypothetical protein